MAGARNITGLLALVIVSVDKETSPLPSEVVPACRNRNIPMPYQYRIKKENFKKNDGLNGKRMENLVFPV